jgi:hypothetical protein
MQRIILSIIASIVLISAASAQCASGYTQLNNVFVCQQNTGSAPVITSSAMATGTVGSPFSYQITATNTPTSFGATSLPSPLTVNTSTGLISGTPTATSIGTVGLSATNSFGTGTQNLSLTINPTGSYTPITAVNLTSNTSSAAGNTVTTASISPGANKLDIVTVQGFISSNNSVPTVTGAGGTWTQITTAVTADGTRRTTLFRDLSASPGSGPLTISFGQGQNPASWSVDEFSNTDTTGTHGSGAIVQSVPFAQSTTTTTGASISLAAFFSPHDVAFGSMRINQNQKITAGAGFTELANVVNAAGGSGLENEWALNLSPLTWTWPSQGTQLTGVGVEIKSATP